MLKRIAFLKDNIDDDFKMLVIYKNKLSFIPCKYDSDKDLSNSLLLTNGVRTYSNNPISILKRVYHRDIVYKDKDIVNFLGKVAIFIDDDIVFIDTTKVNNIDTDGEQLTININVNSVHDPEYEDIVLVEHLNNYIFYTNGTNLILLNSIPQHIVVTYN